MDPSMMLDTETVFLCLFSNGPDGRVGYDLP